jgi:hypothetical protein
MVMDVGRTVEIGWSQGMEDQDHNYKWTSGNLWPLEGLCFYWEVAISGT